MRLCLGFVFKKNSFKDCSSLLKIIGLFFYIALCLYNQLQGQYEVN